MHPSKLELALYGGADAACTWELQIWGRLKSIAGTPFKLTLLPFTGLAFPSISVGGVTPLFTEMLHQKVVAAPVFSFWMCEARLPVPSKVDDTLPTDDNNANGMPQELPKPVAGGMLTFGGYDPAQFEGPLHYIPLTNTTYWEVCGRLCLSGVHRRQGCP